MNKKIKAFTLVEMLIVMGILIILMAVGIVATRYAINRANEVAIQNAADRIYVAAQAYYSDNRVYPAITGDTGFSDAIFDEPDQDYFIGTYLDDGAFDLGPEATFYYWTDGLQNEVLVCVSLFGRPGQTTGDRDGNFYCAGNAFGSEEINISTRLIERVAGGDDSPAGEPFGAVQDWDGTSWVGAGT